MPTLNCEFTRKYSLEERKSECDKIRQKHPDKIPVILVASPSSSLGELETNKYLLPSDLTVGHFIYVIRTKMKLSSEKAFFLFIDGIIPATTSILGQLYDKHKSEDGFIYFTITSENTFG